MDGNELWEKACALMRQEMNHVTYSTLPLSAHDCNRTDDSGREKDVL